MAEFSSRQIREVKRNGKRRAVLFNGGPSHASIFVERDYVNFPTNVLTAPITIEGTPFGQAKAEISERLKNTEWTATIAEIRDIQKQAAQEPGQWIKRTESLDLNHLFERMSDAEMEAVINSRYTVF